MGYSASAQLEATDGMQRNVPLAPLTTFGVGGAADYFLSVTTREALINACRRADTLGVRRTVIAGGSNVVCQDGTLRGLTIHIAQATLPVCSGVSIRCDAGVLLRTLITTAIDHSLAGLESLSGIPGTVGGALVGNAGAYGHTIGEVVASVEVLDHGEVRSLTHEECAFRYRESVFKEQPFVLLSATFELVAGDRAALAIRASEIIALREKKYSPAIRCPGSFFKNVLVNSVSSDVLARIDTAKIIDGKIPAGYLLEAVGARGMRTEHLEVASFHGNLIMNHGCATFDEVRMFAELLRARVRDRFGIVLEEEVRYIT